MLGCGHNALGVGQNGLSEHLLVSYTFGGGEYGLSKLLQESYTLGGGQNGLSELHLALISLLDKLVKLSYALFATGYLEAC